MQTSSSLQPLRLFSFVLSHFWDVLKQCCGDREQALGTGQLCHHRHGILPCALAALQPLPYIFSFQSPYPENCLFLQYL